MGILNILKMAYKKALTTQRTNLLYGKCHIKSNPTVKHITIFNKQHGVIRDIMSKYWYLLISDTTVFKICGSFPTDNV